jgi:hypothetical protein
VPDLEAGGSKPASTARLVKELQPTTTIRPGLICLLQRGNESREVYSNNQTRAARGASHEHSPEPSGPLSPIIAGNEDGAQFPDPGMRDRGARAEDLLAGRPSAAQKLVLKAD